MACLKCGGTFHNDADCQRDEYRAKVAKEGVNIWVMAKNIKELQERVHLLEREMEKVSPTFVEPD